MLRFWVREILGWILVIGGLYIFMIALAILLNPPARILEAPAVVVVGIIVFRGGIHLLKVAVAARVCMATQAEVRKEAVGPKATKKAETPWDW